MRETAPKDVMGLGRPRELRRVVDLLLHINGNMWMGDGGSMMGSCIVLECRFYPWEMPKRTWRKTPGENQTKNRSNINAVLYWVGFFLTRDRRLSLRKGRSKKAHRVSLVKE